MAGPIPRDAFARAEELQRVRQRVADLSALRQFVAERPNQHESLKEIDELLEEALAREKALILDPH